MKTKSLLLIAALFSPFCLMAATAPVAKVCPACPKGPTDYETWISFLPAIFFLLILIITTIKLKNDGTKLSDLLAEKEPQVPAGGAAAAVAAGGGAPAAPAAAPTQTSSQSVSRFIAFLTGMVALTIGICICTFFMYSYFSSPANANTLDLSKLTNVIWGLGIGVLPYGFNKASSALKSN